MCFQNLLNLLSLKFRCPCPVSLNKVNAFKPLKSDMEYDLNLSEDTKQFLFHYPLRFITFAIFAFHDTVSIIYLVLYCCSRYAFPSWNYLIAGAYYAWSFTRLAHIQELIQILILRSQGALPWQRVLFTVIYTGIPSVAYTMVAQGCHRALHITGPIRSI